MLEEFSSNHSSQDPELLPAMPSLPLIEQPTLRPAAPLNFNLNAMFTQSSPDSVSHFVLLARRRLTLLPHGRVNGHLGVSSNAGSLTIAEHATVDGDVYASSVELRSWARVNSVYANTVAAAQNTWYTRAGSFPALPLSADVWSPENVGENVTLAPHTTMTLGQGSFNHVSVRSHAVLRLEGGNYVIGQLDVAPHAQLLALEPVTLLLKSRLDVASHASLLAEDETASSVYVLSAGATLDVREHAVVRAIVVAPSATATLHAQGYFAGSVIADTISVAQHAHVEFESGFSCRPQTCKLLNVACGVYEDGCGGFVNCGACSTPQDSCAGLSLSIVNIGTRIIDQAFPTSAMSFAIPPRITLDFGSPDPSDRIALEYETASGERDECVYVPDSARTHYSLGGCFSGAVAGDLRAASAFELSFLTAIANGEQRASLRLPAEPCMCEPATCGAVSATCGLRDDGCGGVLNCGQCDTSQSCGGNPVVPNACGCSPLSCVEAQAECGRLEDGCGGVLNCGGCQAPDECSSDHKCSCAPATCEGRGAQCGTVSDGCGSFLDCGICAAPQSCGGGGSPNRCGCTRLQCKPNSCGVMSDLCGSETNCGGCDAGETCNDVNHECEPDRVFVQAQDPALGNARISVPRSAAAAAQWFSIRLDPSLPAGSLVDSDVGVAVTVGPLVDFMADGFSDFEFDGCADLSVPVLPDYLASQGATWDDLIVFYKLDSPTGPILRTGPHPQQIDPGRRTVSVCSTHLSGWVVALRSFCDVPVASPGLSIEGNPATNSPPLSVTSAAASRLPRTLFSPPSTLLASADQNTSACVSFALFYGDESLNKVCFYNNAQYTADPGCEHDRVVSCSSLPGTLRLTACYDLATAAPSRGMYVGTVNGANVWIDPTLSSPNVGVTRASQYALRGAFVQRSMEIPAALRTGTVGNVTNIATRVLARSHPLTCRGPGYTCRNIPNGCGGYLNCGECDSDLECSVGGEIAGLPPNVCWCPPGAACNGGGYQLCGSVTMNLTNPCLSVTCRDALNGIVDTATKKDGTSCSDGDQCNGIERCFDGTCKAGLAPPLDDGDPCTSAGSCSQSGVAYAPAGLADCSDGCFVPDQPSTISLQSQQLYTTRAAAIEAQLRASCPTCPIAP